MLAAEKAERMKVLCRLGALGPCGAHGNEGGIIKRLWDELHCYYCYSGGSDHRQTAGQGRTIGG